MIIEHTSKGHVEMMGITRKGRIATIERLKGAYVVRAYEIAETDYGKPVVQWEAALAIFNSVTKTS